MTERSILQLEIDFHFGVTGESDEFLRDLRNFFALLEDARLDDSALTPISSLQPLLEATKDFNVRQDQVLVLIFAKDTLVFLHDPLQPGNIVIGIADSARVQIILKTKRW
jgi:hypothetical protein